MLEFWIILTGALVAVSCGLLGTYLVLRKMAMVGDAISHAVLPGIVIAYMISGQRDSSFILLGAAVLGLLATFLIEIIHKKGKLQADASIGITFTFLFAIGIILISLNAGHVDLDQDCVLYGDITLVPFDLGLLGIPAAVWEMGVVLLLIIVFVIVGYKELFITTFDPKYASALGISTALWHYLLMGAVSITSVAAFESVGAILVVAFLIAPAATAYLLTDKLSTMLWLAAAAGVISSIGGYFLAAAMDGSISGAMATVAGLEFTLAMFFSPTQGIFFKSKREILPPEELDG